MIALGQRFHALANLHHDARPFVAHDSGKQAFGIGAGYGEFIGVANAVIEGREGYEVQQLDPESDSEAEEDTEPFEF